jgi:hypothetical protein
MDKVKELTVSDLSFVFEHDIKMAMYTLERYQIEANLALVACADNDIDKAHVIESLRQSDIAKKVNDHYIAILFTYVDHSGARCALQKLIDKYHQFDLKGSLIMLKKGETSEGAFKRLLQANSSVHNNPYTNIFDEFDDCHDRTLAHSLY